MFRVENNVPDVYVSESRDFQLLCRLYDLAFQGSRYSINTMQDISDTRYINSALLPLLSTKIGYFTDHSVDDSTLRIILTCYPYLVRCKGTYKCIKLLFNMYQRITDNAFETYIIGNQQVTFYLKHSILYPEVLQELLQQLVPAGYTTNLSIEGASLSDVQYGVAVKTNTPIVTDITNEPRHILSTESDVLGEHHAQVGLAQLNDIDYLKEETST